ncbi:hypothetical protein K2173_015775 [Erythroxylum novogranatense]|uniref:RWP-RK domain-containing protein n=1 Tax=Erythroxylum novogranatense TaxID=1862640 RepID=A0AAV8SF17_9ROSI|nr:hypothetical protein K2173_015775 [Erythroxylum novogranatense]
MADPMSVVPYCDPYDNPSDYDYLHFMANDNPTLACLSPVNQQPPSSFPPQPNDDVVGDVSHYDEDLLWNLFSDDSISGQPNEAGPSHTNVGTSNVRIGENGRPVEGNGKQEENNRLVSDENLGDNFSDAIPLEDWPPTPMPYLCSCCQVLREIIHTDGIVTTKLEIHGRLGLICHAIFDVKDHVNRVPPVQSRMYDFCQKSMENIKQFLLQYCYERSKQGLAMVQDPLTSFYTTLCVGLDLYENLNNDDFSDSSPTHSVERQPQQAEGGNDTEREPTKRSNLSQQRERASKLTLKDIGEYFHLPIEEAARRLNLCPTVVKKICRRDGLRRWPHRKIKSIQRQIASLNALSNSTHAEERSRARAQIKTLQDEIAGICTRVSR